MINLIARLIIMSVLIPIYVTKKALKLIFRVLGKAGEKILVYLVVIIFFLGVIGIIFYLYGDRLLYII